MGSVEDDKELLMGIEKVAEFSSQLSKVLLSLGQGFKTLQNSCNKTEESVIDIKESLKKTRSKMEVIALQAKSGGAGRRESLAPTTPLPTSPGKYFYPVLEFILSMIFTMLPLHPFFQ